VAEKWHCRPSELLDLTTRDPYLAFQLDEACYNWGRAVEAAMDRASSQIKQKDDKNGTRRRNARAQALLRMLNGPDLFDGKEEVKDDKQGDEPKPVPKGRFRDPMALISKK
jgi:hypothetical protein